MTTMHFADTETMDDFLAQSGVKGMKWGVRRNRLSRDGSGTLKVQYQPTYTNAERRAARAGVKAAKGSRSTSVDREGFDQTRLAKLSTPMRRAVNGVLGTKVSNLSLLASGTAAVAAIATGGIAPAAAVGGVLAVGGVAKTYDAYKVFFANRVNNPRVSIKTKLTPEEMAKFQTGKDLRQALVSKHGSVRMSSIDGTRKLEVFDREGRQVGGQVLKRKAYKQPKGPKEAATPKP